jgi:hypothetical protein
MVFSCERNQNCLRQTRMQMRSHPANNGDQIQSVAIDGEGFDPSFHELRELKDCGTANASDGCRKNFSRQHLSKE